MPVNSERRGLVERTWRVATAADASVNTEVVIAVSNLDEEEFGEFADS
jgi:hypothetical protein